MVFWQWSDTNQKENYRAFFVSWSEAERYKKQDLLTHNLPTNLSVTFINSGSLSQILNYLPLLNLKNGIHQAGI